MLFFSLSLANNAYANGNPVIRAFSIYHQRPKHRPLVRKLEKTNKKNIPYTMFLIRLLLRTDCCLLHAYIRVYII